MTIGRSPPSPPAGRSPRDEADDAGEAAGVAMFVLSVKLQAPVDGTIFPGESRARAPSR
jgi:hypothetical protein